MPTRRSNRLRYAPQTFTPSSRDRHSRPLSVTSINTKDDSDNLLANNSDNSLCRNNNDSKKNLRKATYPLNRKKAAVSKIDAANREHHFSIDCKNDNLVFEFSAACYEEFKTVVKGAIISNNLVFDSYEKTEENGLVVEVSLSVIKNQSQLYRINCYHTTSRVVANGRDLIQFVQTVLPEVINILSGNKQFDQTNLAIKDVCNKFLSLHGDIPSSCSGYSVRIPNIRSYNLLDSSPSSTTMLETLPSSRGLQTKKQCSDSQTHVKITTSTEPKIVASDTCPVCNRFCEDKSVECSTCLYWFHYDCL